MGAKRVCFSGKEQLLGLPWTGPLHSQISEGPEMGLVTGGETEGMSGSCQGNDHMGHLAGVSPSFGAHKSWGWGHA